eukprot:scaffold31447_cov135-Isochrysis_galbana.AAC.1
MVATLTNVRELNEWCNTDVARRNPIECPKFYAELSDGQLQRCAYDPVESRCTLRNGQICAAGPSPPPPLPPPAAAMLCSEMIAALTNTRTLDPPEWCDTDPARRTPEECPKFYTTTSGDGGLQRCGYDPVRRQCLRNRGQLCIQD